LFDWKKHQEQELDLLLGRKTLNDEKEDKWVWKESDDTRFTVQSSYRVFKGKVQGEDSDLLEGFWRIKSQPTTLVTA